MIKPNILILMPDQQRADCMGCTGNPVIKTPNMDRLAAEGTLFTEAATVSPICMPARASFINGLYPHNHGMWRNRGQMPAEDETFFHILQHAGYFTAHIGKSHYYVHKPGRHMRECEPYMHARGLEYVHETTGPYASCHARSYMTDDWERKRLLEPFKKDYAERIAAKGGMVRPSPLPVEDFLDSYIGRRAVEFVNGYDDSRPVCLFVGFGGPHDPWDAPGQYATMYNPAKMPKPIPVPGWTVDCPEWIRGKKDFGVLPPSVLDNTPAIRANYYGKVSLIDHWIGEILKACSNKGWTDDMLVILWSDHGEMLGDHGRIEKMTFHESSVRVPLILRWPGKIPTGTRTNAMAEIIDVFPTILEAVQCEPSSRCLGRSLWPAIKDPAAPIRNYQLSEIFFGGRNIMIRSQHCKYAIDEQSRGFMLYDLDNDPQEQNNLIVSGDRPELEKQMREALLKRLVEAQYRI